MFIFVLAVALGFTHLALVYDSAAWVPAVMLYIITLLTAVLMLYQEVVNMTLPRIRRLDLRKGSVIPRRVAANDTCGPWPHIPFPKGWEASS